jgi:ABC-type transporter Mla MlaB component
MRTITISDEDAAQVQAILMTHAELQDHRTLESMTLLGRLKRDEPEAARDTINDLQEQIDDFEIDCDNLRRIAVFFS